MDVQGTTGQQRAELNQNNEANAQQQVEDKKDSQLIKTFEQLIQES